MKARIGELLFHPECKYVYIDAADVEWVTDRYVMAHTGLFQRRPRTTGDDWWISAVTDSDLPHTIHPTVIAETRVALVDEPVAPVRAFDGDDPALQVLAVGPIEVMIRQSLWEAWTRTGLCPALAALPPSGPHRPPRHRIAWLDQDDELRGLVATRAAS